ncbi:hypothetical protein [Mycobacterium sp. 852014-50255_SCH5639931]|uniref:hypothetical protein n=1 Tax=Mycobacterium sp. 852014-50255_SCH5639931 TaxID=1834112 RepID=UPI0007FC3ECE|nr:hypothetical protein [Mycobacterium sp. 852014-50255_SCH5639931]OBB63652.1 hypothetical protein A5758_21780 [Mycobacterium sp. 852014-50255_SCH5639931]
MALPDTAQNLYGWLVTMRNISQAGILPIQLRRWAALSSNGTPERVIENLEILEASGIIVIDWQSEELLVTTFISDDKMGNIKAERGALDECTNSPPFFAPYLARELRAIRRRFHPENDAYVDMVLDYLDQRTQPPDDPEKICDAEKPEHEHEHRT